MKLRLDPTACQAYGLCQEKVPHLVELDEWGYAEVVADVTDADLEAARAAATACPTAALRLEAGK